MASSTKAVNIILEEKEHQDDWIQTISRNILTEIQKAICPTNRIKTLLDKPIRLEPSDINEEANSYRNLSNNEKNIYRVEIDLWKEEVKAYNKQKRDIEQIYTMIYSSVAEVY